MNSYRTATIPILVALVAFVTLAAFLILGLALTGRLNAESTPLVVSLMGTIGIIVSVLLLAFQASINAQSIHQVDQKVDGHLARLTDAALQNGGITPAGIVSPPVQPSGPGA